MRHVLRSIAIAFVLLVPSVGTAAEYWMWEVLELRSYGEERRDLVELLVPWLARLGFGDTTHHSLIHIEPDAQVFSDAGGDFIGIVGRYNCISVAYYTTPGHSIVRGMTERQRSDAFELELTGFLDKLPTPRLRYRMVVGTYTCGDAI